MSTELMRLWREPLLHFLLIGAALFGYYALTNDVGSEVPKRIVIDRGQMAQLAASFERSWMRLPTADELDALVESHVREEVFYREALAMGLDQNDPMVRRRMRMKLEFILDDLLATDVDDDVLNAYLQQHPERFRSDARISFRQVYLNPDRRENLDADAAQLLASLESDASPESIGDATLLPPELSQATQSEIARDFGQVFAERLADLPTGSWTGPVYSSFGTHLLKIDRRVEARLPTLAEIRDRVRREYLAERRTEQKDLAYKKLREGYEIIVDMAPVSQDTASGIAASGQTGETQ